MCHRFRPPLCSGSVHSRVFQLTEVTHGHHPGHYRHIGCNSSQKPALLRRRLSTSDVGRPE